MDNMEVENAQCDVFEAEETTSAEYCCAIGTLAS